MKPYEYGQDSTINALVEQVKRLQRQVDQLPKFQWAIVTQTGPLKIQLEGDAVPLLGTPSTTVSGLAVGDRVRVEFQNNRAVVHGRGSGPAPTPRKIAGGVVLVSPVANSPTQATVTYPVGVFTSAPYVTATAQSTVVGTTVLGVGVTARSVSSVNVVITRTNTTNTNIDWIAVQN